MRQQTLLAGLWSDGCLWTILQLFYDRIEVFVYLLHLSIYFLRNQLNLPLLSCNYLFSIGKINFSHPFALVAGHAPKYLKLFLSLLPLQLHQRTPHQSKIIWIVSDLVKAHLQLCTCSGEDPGILRMLWGELAVDMGRVVCLVGCIKADVISLSVIERVRSWW